jgi:VWFA-related protein
MRQVVILLMTATMAAAQFKSTATLVIAPTVVTDKKGQYVDNLDPGDLVLYDNGVAQPIQVEESFNPVSLVVAIQTSSNSSAILDKLGTSGILFSDLLAGDRGETAIVTFSDEVRVARDFTANPNLLKSTLEGLHVQGDKAVTFDAIMQAFHMLAGRKPDHRRVLLMVAEKRDRSSKLKFSSVLQAAERQNVLIYWLDYSTLLEPFTAKQRTLKSSDPEKNGTPLPPDIPPGNLLNLFTEVAHQGKPNSAEILTRATGGRAVSFVKKDALEDAIQAIAAEVHRQYMISFTPRPGHAGQYHKIRVEVKEHPEMTARTRAGYWSLQ